MARRYYRIEMVCQMVELSPAQLHRYERAGLVAPSGKLGDRPAEYAYTEEDVRRVRRIHRLQRDLGLDLAGTEVAMRLLDQIEDLQRRLAAR
jgi:MerR family transcriptional regulator/heat shock protein HspR